MGESNKVRIRVGIATTRDTPSACCLARLLGTISPQMRITMVTTMVATVDATPTCSGNRSIMISVVQVETAMLARLLPIRIEESDVVKFSAMSCAILAVFEPSSAARRKRILFAELKAISDAEK